MSFPLKFFDCSLYFSVIPFSNPPCSSLKSPLLLIISTSIFKKKVWVFLYFLSISCSLPWTSWFVSCYGDLRFIDEYGRFWVFVVLLKLLCGLCWIYVISLCLWLQKCVICSTHTHSMTWLWLKSNILGFFHISLGFNSMLIEFVVLCGLCYSLM